MRKWCSTEASLDGGPLARRMTDYSPAGEQTLRDDPITQILR